MAAAVLGKLDRQTDASKQVEALMDIKPEFRTKGRELMERTLKATTLVDDIVDGLCRAGLEVTG